MESQRICVVVMSGVEDGTTFKYDTARGDGTMLETRWTITLGRLENCDLRLVNDNYISREHAKLHCIDGHWWLEDCKSRNGTFITHNDDFFKDNRVRNTIPIEMGQLFRVGRTWLRLQPIE